VPHREEGPTSYANASALCARCNQTKENTGWQHRGNAEFLRVSTPTGHHYTVATPPLMPGKDLSKDPPPQKRPSRIGQVYQWWNMGAFDIAQPAVRHAA